MSCCEQADDAIQPQSPGDHDNRFEEQISGALFSDHDDNQLLKSHALAAELERTLAELPGVKTARVHLNLRDPSILSRDRTAPSRAAILVVLSQKLPSPAPADIKRFAEAAVPGLSTDHITVYVAPSEAPEERITSVGPFQVTASSAGQLKVALSVLLGLTILMAVGLIAAGYKIRKLKKRI
jgi:type III secretion protein J